MATTGLQILFESGRELVTRVDATFINLRYNCYIIRKHIKSSLINFMQAQPERDPNKEKWMIGIMVSVTVVKFVLVVYCRRFNNEIVRTYAQDHLFDVITNSIGLGSAVLAIKFYWWIDPIGAILVS